MNYTDLLRRLGIVSIESGHHHCRPGWVQMDCPDCGPGSGRMHLGFHKARGYFHCWVCGKKPTVKTLVQLSGQPSHIIIGLLRETLPTVVQDIRPTGKLVIPKGVGDLEYAHRLYLSNRGFDPDELVALWGVQALSISARLSWRLFIPIVYQYETVSWTTRAIGDGPTRYISASPEEEKLNHKHLLYGSDMARHAAVIVEGPTDAWRIGPGAVATLGLSTTMEQLERMKAYPTRVICFDNSPDAQRRARKLADTLALFPGETHVAVLSGKDPDTSPKREIQELHKRFLD